MKLWMLVWVVPTDGSGNDRDPSVRVDLFTSKERLLAAVDKAAVLAPDQRDALAGGEQVEFNYCETMEYFTVETDPTELSEGSLI